MTSRHPLLILVFLAGCATYHPRPLDRNAIDEGLQAPPADSVSVMAQALGNPQLAPFTFDPSDGLSPDEAAILAVVANPELRAARTHLGLAGAELVAAGVLPNPQLSASADVPQSGDPSATTATGLGISLDINGLFTRGAEKAAARAGRESVHLELAWQEIQVAQQARLQTYRMIFLQKQLGLALEEERALQTNRERLDRAAAAHLATEAERAAATDAFRTARGTRLEIEGEFDSARHLLRRVLGEPPSAEIHLQTARVPFLDSGAPADSAAIASASLRWLATTPDDSLVALLQRCRMDLVALRMGYESQEQTMRAAVMRQFPRINLGLNRLSDTSKVLTLGPALTLDLPFFDRNQGEVATARATREQLRAEYTARVFAARADVADLRQQIDHTNDRLQNVIESLPELRNMVEVYGQALELGTVDALLYYDARTRRFDKELESLRLRQNLSELSVGLETATGGYWTFHDDDPGAS